MKKLSFIILISVVLVASLVPFIFPAQAATDPVTVYFFWGDGCPHCAKEEIFLNKLEYETPGVIVKHFEVWHDSDNLKLLQQVAERMQIKANGVPLTIVGEYSQIGWLSEETTGQQIRQWVNSYIARGGAPDVVANLRVSQESSKPETEVSSDTQMLDLPLFGQINTAHASLFGLTTMIAFLDGFNPCAMWVLLFLLSLLIPMQNRRRAWLLGLAFIGTSGVVYFLFLAAWLNLFLFLGVIAAVRIVIGLIAIVSGYLNLQAWRRQRTGCVASNDEKRRVWFEKIRNVIARRQWWWALFGIVLLAAAVNLVELVCSAGLPAIYTQILSLSDLPAWHYYLYMLWYIFVFMLDDLIVFIIGMISLHAVGISTKYSLYTKLIGGIIILLLGLILIFQPAWLMFG
ncbi:MAG: hypothetical protein ACKKL5_03040 [Candidatus Komeilibacteria bacterium]